MNTAFRGRTFLGTVALTLLSIAGLFVADESLAKVDRTESQTEATRLFTAGKTLLAEGQGAKAIERINDALAIERDNREYMQTLAKAELAAGRNGDAEATLTQLLANDSTDGFANLLMGRVLAKENRFEEAVSYFHRAIYGHWSGDTEGHRRSARFELIDLLAQRDSKGELLAELLPAQQDAPRDLATRIRIGDLFLAAGSPERAEEVFRGIEHDAPANEHAYAGLGKAEFGRGNYRTAERNFQTALRLAPGDEAVRQSLNLCNELLLLDPTLLGLGQEERYRRSLKLVELTAAEINQCTANKPSPESGALLERAAAALQAHVSGARLSEASEANLTVAEQIWQARKKECKAPATGSPLELVMARMAQ